MIVEGSTCDVHAYDANTGELRWVFHGPTQMGILQAGDLEGISTSLAGEGGGISRHPRPCEVPLHVIYYIILYYIILYYIILYYIILYILCILYYIILYSIVLYYIILLYYIVV